MREIKFRLRERDNEIIGYEKWYSGSYNRQGFYYIAEPRWLYSHDNKHWQPTPIAHSRYKDQFTGLHDKNGKEIYEGDVVEILADNQDINRLIVKFGIARREMANGCEVDIPSFYFELIPDDFKRFPVVKNSYGKHDLEMLEIIGNSYENPELLEAQ